MIQNTIGNSAKQLIFEAEKLLNIITERSRQLYENRCNNKCINKIYNQCLSFTPELKCETQFPTGDNCKEQGAQISYDISGGRCSSHIDCISPKDFQIICSQSTLFEDINIKEYKNNIVYAYIGLSNSFRTIYPYFHQGYIKNDKKVEVCTDYTPQYRPWYVGAISGKKVVIIVLDISGSMEGDKKQRSKEAVYDVIDTLGIQDYFAVVLLNEIPKALKDVQQATQKNKDEIKQQIKSLFVGGQTNFQIAFEISFGLIQKTNEQLNDYKCYQNIILFMTDGIATKGLGSAEREKLKLEKNLISEKDYNKAREKEEVQLLQKLQELNKGKNISIFAYAIGVEAHQNILREIACKFNGIWYPINENETKTSLSIKMKSYYQYLSKRVERDYIYYSEIYQSASLGIDMITVSKCINICNEKNHCQCVGVAGVDLSISKLKEFPDYNEIIQSLESKKKEQCFSNHDLNKCELESMRKEQHCCDSPYEDGETHSELINCNKKDFELPKCQNESQIDSPWAEAHLEKLVKASKNAYVKRCSQEVYGCQKKVYDECQSFSPELVCEKEFPAALSCKNQFGAFTSYLHSAGRCSVGVACSENLDKEIICSQASLFDNLDLRQTVQSPIKYSYVGFFNSFRIIYPYIHNAYEKDNRCVEYDPRFRPWYVGAGTGAKNVVLILDISGSMEGERIRIARQAAVSVIETLGLQDWFNVVFFSDKAVSSPDRLIQANEANKQQMIDKINKVNVGGKTNYEAAFEKTFDVFKQTTDLEFGSQCGQNLILFLTDGKATEGLGSGAAKKIELDKKQITQQQFDEALLAEEKQLLDKLQTLNSAILSASIFTYSLGVQADERLPHEISCQFGGIWYKINESASGAELKTKMRSYYTYLSRGLDDNQVVWSEIYKDATTGLDFVTAAKPIYVQNSKGYNELLAVAGVDLNIAEMKNFSDYSSVLYNIHSRIRTQCSKTNSKLTECELDSLRQKTCFAKSPYVGGQDKSNTYCESIESSFAKCPQFINQSPWVNDIKEKRYENKDLTVCCPQKLNMSVLTQFSAILLILLLSQYILV